MAKASPSIPKTVFNPTLFIELLKMSETPTVGETVNDVVFLGVALSSD